MTKGKETEIAAEIDMEIRTLTVRNTPNVRAIRRRYSALLKRSEPAYILDLAHVLIQVYGHRGTAYELIRFHKAAFDSLRTAEIVELGQGIDSWWTVDSFARTLSGPIWMRERIADELVYSWALSPDRWWRRAALVSTVAFNLRSQGGYGDAPRTLAVCQLLVDDQDDMVVKAMSWALRELSVLEPEAVNEFLQEHHDTLAARVKREVSNKLETGLKNPKKNRGHGEQLNLD